MYHTLGASAAAAADDDDDGGGGCGDVVLRARVRELSYNIKCV